MVKQYKNKFRFKIKPIYKYKLQPIKLLFLTQYFKKSLQIDFKKIYKKKFKSIKKFQTLRQVKKKKEINKKKSFLKRRNEKNKKNFYRKHPEFKPKKNKKKQYFKKYLTIKRKRKIIFKKKQFIKYNYIVFWRKIIYSQKKINFKTIKLAHYKLNNVYNLQINCNFKTQIFINNFKTQIFINNLKRQYTKKIVVNQYAWYQNKYLNKLKIIRKRVNRLTNKFRKIKKNNAFNTIFMRQFYILTNLNFKFFQLTWKKFRRTNNKYWSNNQLVSLFSLKLLLSMPNLLFLLGYTISINFGNKIVQSGSIIHNGKIYLQSSLLNPGDVIQLHSRFNILLNHNSKLLQQLPFLHIDLSLMLFMIIRWPYFFEIFPPTFASSRWIRYYIRQIATKNKHINKTWKIYLI